MPGSSSLAQGLSSDYSYPHEDAGGLQTPRAGTPRATLAPAAGLVSTVGQAELDERKLFFNAIRHISEPTW